MSRSVHAAIALSFGLCVFLSLGASGSCTGSSSVKIEGEACTRASECAMGLTCSGGTCRAVDAGPTDAGSGDVGP